MPVEPAPGQPAWRALGASVPGPLHGRSGLPNQDALAWLPEGGAGPPLALAVADGHGSAKSFRSDVGSRLAVEAATQALVEFAHTWGGHGHFSTVKQAAEGHLPRHITRAWREAVEQHLRDHPLSAEELDRLAAQEGEAARRKVEEAPARAYGTTLLAVAVAGPFLLFLQQGDGDVLTVSASGEVERPLPADERLIANETTSLSNPDDVTAFRVGFRVLTAEPPALVLAATDGYANSFREDAGFLKVGADLLRALRAEGPEAVQAKLPAWLRETSEGGSGDDITLGLLCRLDALAPPEAPPAGAPAPTEPQPENST